ncbi:MAG: Gfo/Idh/MocA family oxidoreductase [Armatimonadota bacterium]
MGMTIGAYIDGGGHVGPHMKDVSQCQGIDRLLVTGSEEARGIAAEMEKAQFVDDWQALLDDPDVPAVMVLTNNRDAGRLTLEAVEAGTWAYAEKPGARTVDEMRQIVEACERTGGHFTPCYVRRTFPDTLEIKRLYEAGAVGELWSFQANWITSQAEVRGVDTWFFSDELAGGGILYWLGCHWIDMLRFVTGQRIASVSAMCRTADDRISVEDVACLSVRLEGGAIGTIRCGYLQNPYHGYEDRQLMTAWEGSDGLISHYPHGEITLRMSTRAKGFCSATEAWELAITHPPTGGYALELLDDFLLAIDEERAPLVAEEDALYVLQVAEAAYEASRTGREQTVG